MMGSLPAFAWIFVLIWLVLGNAVYFLYGIRHSRLGKEPPTRMLSLPEAEPLTGNEESLVDTYQSTVMHAVDGGLEHRSHPT